MSYKYVLLIVDFFVILYSSLGETQGKGLCYFLSLFFLLLLFRVCFCCFFFNSSKFECLFDDVNISTVSSSMWSSPNAERANRQQSHVTFRLTKPMCVLSLLHFVLLFKRHTFFFFLSRFHLTPSGYAVAMSPYLCVVFALFHIFLGPSSTLHVSFQNVKAAVFHWFYHFAVFYLL